MSALPKHVIVRLESSWNPYSYCDAVTQRGTPCCNYNEALSDGRSGAAAHARLHFCRKHREMTQAGANLVRYPFQRFWHGPRKIIFCDIDGVLNSTQYWHDNGDHLPMGKAGALDPAAIERLNTIVERTDARVVLSSSWRGTGSIRTCMQVEGMLRERGYRHSFHDSTCYPRGKPRADEIDDWLTRHAEHGPFRFVVLDDDPDAWNPAAEAFVSGCFVNTNYLVGLQDNGVELAVGWLNG